MRKRRKNHINPLKWIGWLFSPILNNGAFFVFMFALGWLCTQLEIMPSPTNSLRQNSSSTSTPSVPC